MARIAGIYPLARFSSGPDPESIPMRRLAWLPLLVFALPVLAQQPLPPSELRDTIVRYTLDRDALLRRYHVEASPARRDRVRAHFSQWEARLDAMDFDRLGVEARIDWHLLHNRMRRDRALLDLADRRAREMERVVPFAATVVDLMEARRRLETLVPSVSSARLAGLAREADSLRRLIEPPARPDTSRAARIVALRSIRLLDALGRTLDQWYRFYAGYDPAFTWWNADPWKRADEAMKAYARALRRHVLGQRDGDEEPIVGDPIGAAQLRAELDFELIPYGPEELIAIAEREFAWSEAEMKRASRDLGYGDDWKRALEHVKNTFVDPGRQPDLARDLAREAEEWVESRGLVTVPPLAKEIWRMEMLSPERQRVAPFFLGGEVLQVAYPTDGMTEEEKLMSLRGNNPHFSRAVVHHELIPGHHLQGFMAQRYNSHRREFSTPFLGEGWALWWEFLLWDLDFPRGPEDRIGMLYWRMHRSARIVFSLRFHLGTMTAREAIDYLVDRVGHERANAEAEVRRSFNGDYPPLYQIAYMVGALQLRGLYRELVETGRMTPREFHDAVLQSGNMPVETIRARLTGRLLPRDFRTEWRF
jgi:uncharacterized protein (DUF885 family)